MISELKQAIGHEVGCARMVGDITDHFTLPECNCSRREMIAFLDRLEHPTEAMRCSLRGETTKDRLREWELLLKAAEENT